MPVEAYALSLLADATVDESTGEMLLRIAAEARALAPAEAWDEVPTDLAENLDHYLYGHPKRVE